MYYQMLNTDVLPNTEYQCIIKYWIPMYYQMLNTNVLSNAEYWCIIKCWIPMYYQMLNTDVCDRTVLGECEKKNVHVSVSEG